MSVWSNFHALDESVIRKYCVTPEATSAFFYGNEEECELRNHSQIYASAEQAWHAMRAVFTNGQWSKFSSNRVEQMIPAGGTVLSAEDEIRYLTVVQVRECTSFFSGLDFDKRVKGLDFEKLSEMNLYKIGKIEEDEVDWVRHALLDGRSPFYQEAAGRGLAVLTHLG